MLTLVQPTWRDPLSNGEKDDAASREALGREPLVIHQREEKSGSRALVVFVHGLGGVRYGSRATWGRLPAFIYEDFPGVDVGLYSYRTLFQ